MLRQEDLAGFNCELPHQSAQAFYVELLKQPPPSVNDISSFYLGLLKFQIDTINLMLRLWK